MTIHQLHYTSCESESTGRSGFQFQAASDGVPPDVMARAERLAAYTPPSDFPGRPTHQDIAAAPVALRHDPTPPALVSCSAYVGLDYSLRYGSFFAHTIAADRPDEELAAPSPIELWGSPLWTSGSSPDGELPTLEPPLPGGRITRDAVDAHLDNARRRAQLPALLSAAARSIATRERPVVLVADTTELIASTIAALTYLLPPGLVRSMSFATYHHRPVMCDLHVIGTFPADVDSELERSSFLFRLDGGPDSEVDVHPSAELLATLLATSARSVWSGAISLVPEAATSLDAARDGLLLAVAATGSIEPRDLEATEDAVGRLGATLPTEAFSAVARAVLTQPVRPGTIDGLRSTARALGASDVLEAAEHALAAAAIRALATGRDARPAPLAVASARENAGALVGDLLAGVDLETGLRALAWAAGSQLEVPVAAIEQFAERTVIDAMVRPPISAELVEALSTWPPLRRWAAREMDELLATDEDAGLALLVGPMAGLLETEPLSSRPALKRALLLRAAQADPEQRVAALDELLAHLEEEGRDSDHDVDTLLRRLWPDGAWTAAEAERLLQVIAVEQLAKPAAAAWMDRSILRHEFADDDTCRLAHRASALRIDRLVGAEAADRLAWIVRATNAAGVALEAKDQLALADGIRAMDSVMRKPQALPAGRFLDQCVQNVERVPPDWVPSLLDRWPHAIADSYLGRADERLRAGDTRAAATLFLAAEAAGPELASTAQRLLEVLAPHLKDWRKSALEEVDQRLESGPGGPESARRFAAWRQQAGARGSIFGRRRR